MGVVDGETGHDGDPWSGSLLEGLDDGVYMYFIHSFYVQPQDSSFVMLTPLVANPPRAL